MIKNLKYKLAHFFNIATVGVSEAKIFLELTEKISQNRGYNWEEKVILTYQLSQAHDPIVAAVKEIQTDKMGKCNCEECQAARENENDEKLPN